MLRCWYLQLSNVQENTCIYIHSSIAPSDTFEHKFMKISECPRKNLLEEFKSSISSFFSV